MFLRIKREQRGQVRDVKADCVNKLIRTYHPHSRSKRIMHLEIGMGRRVTNQAQTNRHNAESYFCEMEFNYRYKAISTYIYGGAALIASGAGHRAHTDFIKTSNM